MIFIVIVLILLIKFYFNIFGNIKKFDLIKSKDHAFFEKEGFERFE